MSIAEFIRDKIVADPRGKIKKSELNQQFTTWYRETYGNGSPSPKDVHTYMDKKYGKCEGKGYWGGVKIKYERVEEDNDMDEIPAISLDDLMDTA